MAIFKAKPIPPPETPAPPPPKLPGGLTAGMKVGPYTLISDLPPAGEHPHTLRWLKGERGDGLPGFAMAEFQKRLNELQPSLLYAEWFDLATRTNRIWGAARKQDWTSLTYLLKQFWETFG